MRRVLERFAALRQAHFYIALAAVVLGLTYSFFIYPRLAEPFDVGLDPDNYGKLGYGLLKTGTLSYYPDTEPSLARGPIYPLFLGLSLKVSGELYPQSVQLFQSILFGLTCLLVYWTATTLWGRNIALLASFVCAIHPFLIWYTARIWIETLASFFFSALIASTLFLGMKPGIPGAILVGVILGLSILCKATFLVFLVVLPIGLVFAMEKRTGWRLALLVGLTASILVLPWTIRNWNLTGKIIPVHLLAGYNLQRGDSFVEHYRKAPLSHSELWDMSIGEIDELQSSLLPRLRRWEQEMIIDSVFMHRSLGRYLEHPEFLLKKVVLNGVMFWTLGGTPPKSVFISILQIPLVFTFVIAALRMFRLQRGFTIQRMHILLVITYYIIHLPFFAVARFSVVLVPTMILYGASLLSTDAESGDRFALDSHDGGLS